MTDKIEVLITKLLSIDTVAQGKVAIEIMDYYTKVSALIERTHLAMGKKTIFRVSTLSTVHEKLNTNAFSSTHQNFAGLE